MLIVKRTREGYYYISLDGECIHGGLSKEQSISYLKSYQKIWDSGYKFAKAEEADEIADSWEGL